MGLQRSRSDSVMFGLCGGIARSLGIGSGWLRFGAVVGTLMTGGTLFALYILMAMLVPKEPNMYADGYWYQPPTYRN